MALVREAVARLCADQIKAGLRPLVENSMRERYGVGWERRTACKLVGGAPHWEVQTLLKTMAEQWPSVFDQTLPCSSRTLVLELKEWKSDSSYKVDMSLEETARYVDTAARLLMSVGAPNAAEVEALKRKVYLEVSSTPIPAQSIEQSPLVPPRNTEQYAAVRVETPARRHSHIIGAPSWHDCITRLENNLGAILNRHSGRCAFSGDGKVGVCCLVSKKHANQRYWWNLRERQLDELGDIKCAFVAFACGSPDKIAAIPLEEILDRIPSFNPKPGEDGDGWHIHVMQDGPNWWLMLTGKHQRANIRKYMI